MCDNGLSVQTTVKQQQHIKQRQTCQQNKRVSRPRLLEKRKTNFSAISWTISFH